MSSMIHQPLHWLASLPTMGWRVLCRPPDAIPRVGRFYSLSMDTMPSWNDLLPSMVLSATQLWESPETCGRSRLTRTACPSPLGMGSHGTPRHAGRPSSLIAMLIAAPSPEIPGGRLRVRRSRIASRTTVGNRACVSLRYPGSRHRSAPAQASRTTQAAAANCMPIEDCLRDMASPSSVLRSMRMVLVHLSDRSGAAAMPFGITKWNRG